MKKVVLKTLLNVALVSVVLLRFNNNSLVIVAVLAFFEILFATLYIAKCYESQIILNQTEYQLRMVTKSKTINIEGENDNK